MNSKIQVVKTRVRRYAPQVAAIAGATVVGAALMSRHIDYNSRFLTVDSGMLGVIKEHGQGLIFETPAGNQFVLAPIVPV